jgi:hypothetical protein
MKKRLIYRGSALTTATIAGVDIVMYPGSQHLLDTEIDYVAALVEQGAMVVAPEQGPLPADDDPSYGQNAPSLVSMPTALNQGEVDSFAADAESPPTTQSARPRASAPKSKRSPSEKKKA